ncbi:MAG: N-formylglutamate amidohydrolase [Pontixanthobacter sp.]
MPFFDMGPDCVQQAAMQHHDERGEWRSGRKMGGVGVTEHPAYTLTVPGDLPIPVLIAAPHAGRAYSRSVLTRMRDAEYSTIRLEDRYVDRIAEAVAKATGAALLIARCPRAVLDLNRSPHDVDWGMISGKDITSGKNGATGPISSANRRARSGLGLVPRRLPVIGEIWNAPLPMRELEGRIRDIHAPYHTALSATLDRIGDRWGAALLIDIHSMPPIRQPARQATDQADRARRQASSEQVLPVHYVIGDRFGASADDRLTAAALHMFAMEGAAVAHNRPYAGGYILDRHGMPGRGRHGLQLEVCRSLYLDRNCRETTPGLAGVVSVITKLTRLLGERVVRMGGRGEVVIAAE